MSEAGRSVGLQADLFVRFLPTERFEAGWGWGTADEGYANPFGGWEGLGHIWTTFYAKVAAAQQ